MLRTGHFANQGCRERISLFCEKGSGGFRTAIDRELGAWESSVADSRLIASSHLADRKLSQPEFSENGQMIGSIRGDDLDPQRFEGGFRNPDVIDSLGGLPHGNREAVAGPHHFP